MGPVTIYQDTLKLTTVSAGSSGTSTYTPPKLTPGCTPLRPPIQAPGSFPQRYFCLEFYLLIPKFTTTLTLTSSSNPSFLNQPVTFTVTASAADNTIPAPITLTDTTNNTLLATLTPNSSGVATYTISTLSLGFHNIEAAYAGTSSHSSATASLDQQVINGYATTSTLTCSPSTIALGATSLLTAMVTSSNGTPTGSIAFTDNGAALGQPTLTGGDASLTYTGQTRGTHGILASYIPTGSFSASDASCSVTVNGLPTTTTVAVSPNPSTYGQPVIFSAHVAPVTPNKAVPTGKVTVTFCRGATIVATLDASGNASFVQPTPVRFPSPLAPAPSPALTAATPSSTPAPPRPTATSSRLLPPPRPSSPLRPTPPTSRNESASPCRSQASPAPRRIPSPAIQSRRAPRRPPVPSIFTTVVCSSAPLP